MSAPERILFLGKRFYTNKDALEERFGRVYRLPKLWSEQGVQVLLWLLDYHGRGAQRREDGTLDIRATPIVSFAPFAAFFAARRCRPQVVVAAGDCYVGLLGWCLARLMGARFVFDIYDKYDEFGGYIRPLGLDLFGFLRRRADLKFFCSRGLQAVYEGEAGSGPSLYVANGVDEQEFAPLPLRDCRQKLDLPQDALLVGYFGSMEADRGVADLLQALTLLRGEGVPLQLLLCGRAGPGLDLTQDGVLFRGMVPHADMPCYLNACDVLAIPYRESAIMDMGASCKIAEYLMCVRPLVSTRTANFIANFPEQARELGAALCPALDPAALAAAIRQQLARPQLVSRPEHLAWGHIAADALDAIGKIAAPVPTA